MFSACFPFKRGCFRLRNRVGAPIVCSYRQPAIGEMAVFRQFSYSTVFGSVIGWAALLPAPIAACFCEKMAVFAHFPYSKAVFGSGIGWVLIACSYSSLFLRENGLFFAYFPNPQAVFGSGIGVRLLPAPTAACFARKWLVFRLISLIRRLFSAQE